MQNEHTIPAQNDSTADKTPEKEIPWKNILIGLGAFTLLLIIGLISFIVGKQSKTSEEAPLSPTPTLFGIPTATPTLTPTPISTVSATISPTITPTPEIKTKTLSSEALVDGFRASNGGGNYGLDIRAGRNLYLVARGFISFDLSEIPEGATITEATLRLYQYKIEGDPYGVGGELKVDHLDYGDSLTDEDYAAAALLSSFTTLTNNPTIEWKAISVTDQLKDDLANDRERSQFRIHFATENTGGSPTGDFTYFESADNSGATNNTPQLIVKYY